MNSKSIPFLEDKLLILRPWTDEYTKDFFLIMSNPKVTKPAGIRELKDLDTARIKLNFLVNKKEGMDWSIGIKSDEEEEVIIGNISISKDNSIKKYSNVQEIGYLIDEKYWGRGYASRAVNIVMDYCLNSLGCEAVVIKAFSKNKPSIRVAEKCGFTYYTRTKDRRGIKNTYIFRKEPLN